MFIFMVSSSFSFRSFASTSISATAFLIVAGFSYRRSSIEVPLSTGFPVSVDIASSITSPLEVR